MPASSAVTVGTRWQRRERQSDGSVTTVSYRVVDVNRSDRGTIIQSKQA
jgi:hypothetical protein